MQYSRGIQTKEAIYGTAKHLMYVNGFKKTTYAMIAEAAKVPVGLVNYYYKKQDFIYCIYRDFIEEITCFLEKQVGEVKENELLRHIISSRIMLTQIFSDPRILAFHLEINKEHLLPRELHELVRQRQMKILEHFHVEVTAEYYYWCVVCEYGARREMLELCRDLPVDSEEFVKMAELFATIAVRVAGLNREVIDENLGKARKLIGTLEYSHLKLLE